MKSEFFRIDEIDYPMRLIPSGEFIMGEPLSELGSLAENHQQRKVTTTNPFYIGQTPVSVKHWLAVMKKLPKHTSSISDLNTNVDCPIACVSWDECDQFIQTINVITGIFKFRLPTEAEWEYACRAGTNTVYSFGDDPELLLDYAWTNQNSKKPQKVAQKKPTNWDLYDMHGNVCEWCSNFLQMFVSIPNDEINPKGPQSGEFKVNRGGS